MATVFEVVSEAWKKAGVLGLGQSMTGDDTASGVADFNDMISQWNTQRWLTWGLLDLSFTSTGAATYTVGPTGNFVTTVAPTRIEAAYQRQLINPPGLNVDTPLEIIPSNEEYSRLSIKQLTSFGLYVFLDTSTLPNATLRLYPIPNAAIYQIHILLKNVQPVFTVPTIGSTMVVPPHYIAAMKWNLAKIYRASYGKRPDPQLNAMAKSTLEIVKQSNLQVPELVMPKVLVLHSSGYNILSDQFGNG